MAEPTELVALGAQLAAAPTEEALLSEVVEGVAPLLGVDYVSVHLLDGTALRTHARSNDPFHRNAEAPFGVGTGLVGWVAQHAESLRVVRAEDDPRFLPRPDQRRRIGGFLAVPVKAPEGCLGVISAAAEHDGHFTERHQELLRGVADQVGGHLRRLREGRRPPPGR